MYEEIRDNQCKYEEYLIPLSSETSGFSDLNMYRLNCPKLLTNLFNLLLVWVQKKASHPKGKKKLSVKFEVLTEGSMQMSVFWDVSLCSSVEFRRRFRIVYSLLHQGREESTQQPRRQSSSFTITYS
jgi:hypothetical protein